MNTLFDLGKTLKEAASFCQVVFYKQEHPANNTVILNRFLFFLVVFLVPLAGYAQGENNHWTFGNQLGLQFSSGAPAFFGSAMQTGEGCAAVSASNGRLLFYSNGNEVYNASHAVMPNGSGILGNFNQSGHGSAFQGVVITPVPGDTNRYYLFTLDPIELVINGYPGYLRYSMVDMSLNGGFGDVVAGQKNIVLDSMLSEKMATAKGDGCYNWLLVHERDNNKFHSFKIGFAGISQVPVISSSGQLNLLTNHTGYQIKMSPNDSLLVNTSLKSAELHDFNRTTGVVSNNRVIAIDSQEANYGCEFSPDNSKLYLTSVLSPRGLTQFDLSLLPNMTAVNSSRTVINSVSRLADLRAAPDGKIYIIDLDSNRLAVLQRPNLQGTACGYTINSGVILPGFGLSLSLGAKVITAPVESIGYYSHDTVVCFNGPLAISGPVGYSHYTWSDGTPGAENIFTAAGTKWVKSIHGCDTRIDTFRVIDPFASFDNTLGGDTVLCLGDSILLRAQVPYAQYTWNDGSHGSSLTVKTPGVYSVSISAASCRKTAKVTITEKKLNVYLGDDRTLCEGEELRLDAATKGVSYLWQDGSRDAILKVPATGRYWVQLSEAACRASDTVMITFRQCNCTVSLPNAFTPNNDGRNDTYKPVIYGEPENYELNIYNRWGQCVFTSFDPRAGWDGITNNKISDLGTYFYKLRVKCFRGKEEFYSGEMILIR